MSDEILNSISKEMAFLYGKIEPLKKELKMYEDQLSMTLRKLEEIENSKNATTYEEYPECAFGSPDVPANYVLMSKGLKGRVWVHPSTLLNIYKE